MAETHDPVAQLDIVRAYHFGPKFLVEIELVANVRDTLCYSERLGRATRKPPRTSTERGLGGRRCGLTRCSVEVRLLRRT